MWRWRSSPWRRSRGLRLLAWALLGLTLLSALPVLGLRWIDPPASSFMLQSRLAHRERPGWRLQHEWVEARRIAPSMGLAVVASEDQLFAEHAGFDLRSIAEAVSESRSGGRRRGASTISQQVTKNLFLWPGRSLLRKGLEAWLTLWIELLWPKERILEVYLNVAQFGDGIFGVEAASRHFFAKPAWALTPHESALLAAVLPNPLRLHAARPSPYVRERAAWILDQMGHSVAGPVPAEVEDSAPPAAEELAPAQVGDSAEPTAEDLAPAEVEVAEPVEGEDLAPAEVEVVVPPDFEESAPAEGEYAEPLEEEEPVPAAVEDGVPPAAEELAPPEWP